MNKEIEDPIENSLDEFFQEFREIVTGSANEDLLRIFQEDITLHIEDRLYDKVIVYMGDKATERVGKKKDLMEIAVLSYLIWLKKRT